MPAAALLGLAEMLYNHSHYPIAPTYEPVRGEAFGISEHRIERQAALKWLQRLFERHNLQWPPNVQEGEGDQLGELELGAVESAPTTA